MPLIREPDQIKSRYLRTPHNEVIMEIKDKIIDICKIVMNFQNNMRLSMFLNQFAQNEKKQNMQTQKYCTIYSQALKSGSFKKFDSQLRQLASVQDEICENVNQWVRNTYNERVLDLQTIS